MGLLYSDLLSVMVPVSHCHIVTGPLFSIGKRVMTFFMARGIFSCSSDFHHQGGATIPYFCGVCSLEALSQVYEYPTLYTLYVEY